ncbi:hypothetical protein JHK87_055956 [Glycine soja]|nr:hypothetical protein JHK87_055956 [Glycine soja]
MKTQMTNIRERDRLSELSDCVLLHILNFMETIYAVRTCILSKRNKYVSQVLSSRDGYVSLLKLHFWSLCSTQYETLSSALRYAALYNVQQLTIDITSKSKFINKSNCFDPLIFSCPSLTILKLDKSFGGSHLELPTSLQLPVLKALFLANVGFTATDNGCTEPFSTCNMLNTLVLRKCSLHKDAEDLSNNATMRTQPPCFVRLESLKILKYLHVVISDEEFNRVTKYLLENSPMTRASLINA